MNTKKNLDESVSKCLSRTRDAEILTIHNNCSPTTQFPYPELITESSSDLIKGETTEV